jgi:hypothetical protein
VIHFRAFPFASETAQRRQARGTPHAQPMIPLWLKLLVTVCVAVIVVVYWIKYGPANFLWFSDVALIATVPAVWLESGLIASAMAVGVLIPEIFWNLSYFLRLASGSRLTGLTDYMFDRTLPLWLRALSLFHVGLPILLLWLIHRLGYSPMALVVQTGVAWVVLPLTYALTDRKQNINWVFGWGGEGAKTRSRPVLYLVGVMLAFPVMIYLPTHLILLAIFSRDS